MPETMTMTTKIPAKETWPSNPPNNGICKTQVCKGPLTWLGPPWNNWLCLNCYTHPTETAGQKTEPRKRRDVDRQLSEERVREMINESSTKVSVGLNEEEIREIIQDELQNWFIQKPLMTRDEIAETLPTSMIPEQTWRQEAKDLGISLMKEPVGSGARKKEDVLADIEAKKNKGDSCDIHDKHRSSGSCSCKNVNNSIN